MSRLASPAWNNASRQGWQLCAALVPCTVAVIGFQPNTITLITSALLAAFLCVISVELIDRRFNPRDTRKSCTASLNSHSCFNALLLALSLSLFIDLAQATDGGNFAWENQGSTLRFLLSTPIALGAVASLIAFLGISPLFNRKEAGPFSLPALTLALTLTLTALNRETDTMTSPLALAAMAFGVCWLCWLRLLRLLPIAVFVALVVGACFVSEPESFHTVLSMHLGALVVMPMFIARLELNSAANIQTFVAGFMAGIVYCYLTVFSDAPYSPLFALCVATLLNNASTPYLETLFIRANSRAAATSLAISLSFVFLSALVLLRWLTHASETVTPSAVNSSHATFAPLILGLLAFVIAGITRFFLPHCRRWLLHRRLRRREAIAASGQTVLRARVTGVLHRQAKE
ncbi:MAG: hypothetical protein ISP89_01055 [Pseudomonadales bacterium]|jgi:hypothetical protein|nr:hypothetical protein [Pseudomonadales bacterium]